MTFSFRIERVPIFGALPARVCRTSAARTVGPFRRVTIAGRGGRISEPLAQLLPGGAANAVPGT